MSCKWVHVFISRRRSLVPRILARAVFGPHGRCTDPSACASMAVSKPSRGTDPNGVHQAQGRDPSTTSQLATSVAPFQLA